MCAATIFMDIYIYLLKATQNKADLIQSDAAAVAVTMHCGLNRRFSSIKATSSYLDHGHILYIKVIAL